MPADSLANILATVLLVVFPSSLKSSIAFSACGQQKHASQFIIFVRCFCSFTEPYSNDDRGCGNFHSSSSFFPSFQGGNHVSDYRNPLPPPPMPQIIMGAPRKKCRSAAPPRKKSPLAGMYRSTHISKENSHSFPSAETPCLLVYNFSRGSRISLLRQGGGCRDL